MNRRERLEQMGDKMKKFNNVYIKNFDSSNVRVEAGEQMDDELKDFALHYATLKGSLIIGINEDVFKRAIDRHANPKKSEQKWLGDHVAGREYPEILLQQRMSRYGTAH